MLGSFVQNFGLSMQGTGTWDTAAKKAVEEQIGTTVKGRQLYQQAVKDLEGNRTESAVRALKLAMTFEPQNERFKAKLREAEKALSKGGPDFRIR